MDLGGKNEDRSGMKFCVLPFLWWRALRTVVVTVLGKVVSLVCLSQDAHFCRRDSRQWHEFRLLVAREKVYGLKVPYRTQGREGSCWQEHWDWDLPIYQPVPFSSVWIFSLFASLKTCCCQCQVLFSLRVFIFHFKERTHCNLWDSLR